MSGGFAAPTLNVLASVDEKCEEGVASEALASDAVDDKLEEDIKKYFTEPEDLFLRIV